MRLYFVNNEYFIEENTFTIPFMDAEYIEILCENPSEYSESHPDYVPPTDIFYIDIEDGEFMSDYKFYEISKTDMDKFIRDFINTTDDESIERISNYILDGYIDIHSDDEERDICKLFNISKIDIYTIIDFIRIRIAASLKYKAVEIYNPYGPNHIRLIPDLKMYRLKDTNIDK